MIKTENKRKQQIIQGLLIFVCIMLVYVIIQALNGLYPFGGKSNLLWDEDIQYVDFFAYFRDVLLGKSHIAYSFSKSLGGSLMALFGYYLACPLNLLVVLFQKDQIPMFLFLLTMVKLGLSGVTTSIFLRKRFVKLSDMAVMGLSIAYGLMQYSMLQLSNIMWLDGVILLPILLLAIYEFITKDKKVFLFAMVLISIAMNWYTGYMTCLFGGCYYIYERILCWHGLNKKENLKALTDSIRFGIVMILGVLGSCFLFYPVFKGLQNGKEVFDLEIFRPSVYDNFFDVLRGFTLGSIMGTVSLYCGLLFFGFLIYFFVSRSISKKEKIVSGIAVLFTILSTWFVPLDCIWSGFRFVASYRFRYSFIFIFLIIFLAGRAIESYEEKEEYKKLAIIMAAIAVIFVLLHLLQNFEWPVKMVVSCAFVLGYAVIYLFVKSKQIRTKILAVCLIAELLVNGFWTFQYNYGGNPEITAYQNYVNQEEKLVDDVRSYDDSTFYRMDSVQKRDQAENRCSAYLCESMVYRYSSVSHYSSTFDTNISDLIYKIGYSTEDDLSIFGESILPADALLGTKYMLSDRAVMGYNKVDSIDMENGKEVYENPYALGLGFAAADTVSDVIDVGDPFLYQNALYSNILGEDVELYHRVKAEGILENGVVTFQIPAAEGNTVLYGKVNTWSDDIPIALSVDGAYRCNYADWLSYQVFALGDGNAAHTVTMENYVGDENGYEGIFYVLDMDAFQKAIEKLRSMEVKVKTWDDGLVQASYDAAEDGQVLLTVPYADGWSVTVNGEAVDASEGAEAFTVIPVSAGANEIEMTYQVPGLKMGIILSVAAILMMIGWVIWERRKHAK